MNEFKEIIKLLGTEYHLGVKIGIEKNSWKLFRNYIDTDVYFSKDNKAIMTSEKNTLEELHEFAKKHHKIDEHFVMNKISMIFSMIVCFIAVSNIYFKNNYIFVFILTSCFYNISYSVIAYYIWNKNANVRMLELRENMEKIMKKDKEK